MKNYSRMLSIIMILAMIMTSSIFTVFATNGAEGATQEESLDVEYVEGETEEPVANGAVSDTPKNAAVSFTITFKDGDKTATQTVTAEEGATSASYTLPSAKEVNFTAPEGKVFDKWDIGAAGKVITVESDIVATAEWKDEVIVPDTPDKPIGLKANATGKKVVLSWNKVSDANEYAVYVNDKCRAITDETSYSLAVSPYYNTKFEVTARASYEDNGETKYVESPKSAYVYWRGIKVMEIKFKVKSACKLKSHGGKKQTIKLRKGEVITASMFSGGKYIFTKNGSVFWMNRTRAKSPAAYYTKSFDYSWEEAENFVNQYGIGSSTKQMIWVSTYTQRAYYFTGTRGNWTCRRSWDVSTGKASTPTPTGKTYGTMAIQKKLKNRHSIPYWSCFSSFNAFHGKKKSWKMGAPASGGCVRNNVSDAQWIYNNVSKKSRAFVY